jgi:hypothetical protein
MQTILGKNGATKLGYAFRNRYVGHGTEAPEKSNPTHYRFTIYN